jgi:hypothetical protein
MDDSPGFVLGLAIMGLIGGLVLFTRGLVAYQRDRRISAVATSSLDGLAAGEVRVTGVVEALDQQLVSPLQSRPCVWYRARIESTDDSRRVLLDEERAVHFRIADGRGRIRVAPAGARWEIGVAFDEATSLTGGEPPGLAMRQAPSFGMVVPDDPASMTDAGRQAAIDALLTVRQPSPARTGRPGPGDGGSLLETALASGSGRRYRESRLEVGDAITVLGQALPWSDVQRQLDIASRNMNVEQEMAQDLSTAREAGLLAASPEAAWGNAAIPGFGIGRPTRPPELDPAARPPDLSGSSADEPGTEHFDIPDDELVVAHAPDAELVIYRGSPLAATRQHDRAFLLGLVGAVMSVCCALALVSVLGGSL